MDDASNIETSRISTQTPISLMGKEEKMHTIESFAMRPMEIGNFTLSTTTEANKNIFKYEFLSLLNNTNVKGKFDGFRYFRADIQVQVYYNAQPFQQAALLGYYIPYQGDNQAWSQKHDLTSKTACLSESVLLEDQEPLVLNIPFNHPHGFIDLVDPEHCDLGQFNLDVYSPLESNIASDTISITIFAHFINIKLYGPTDEERHVELEAQMGCHSIDENSRKAKNIKDVVNKLHDSMLNKPILKHVAWPVSRLVGSFVWLISMCLPVKKLDLEPQMGEAEEQEKVGIVTKVSGVVKEVSSALSNVPVVGVVAKPISWVSAAINKVASLFGWSKPISVHTTGVFKPSPARYMANYNGVDTSNNMGLDADNQVGSYAFFGKEDPLDFNNIVTRPNFITSHVWKTSQDNYTKLFSVDISPTAGWSILQDTNTTADKYAANIVRSFTQLNFVAQFFKYWRGNVVIQLKCVKTKFHSGRLLITWRPGSKVTSSNPKVPMTYSIVWELAKKKSIAFEIPYLNPKPWLFVENPTEKITPSDRPWKNGVLEVFVLNKLVASSDAIKSEVKILVEICGGKDFSFAVPVNPVLFPTAMGSVLRIDPPPTRRRRVQRDLDATLGDDDLDLEPQIGIDSELVPFIPEGTVDVGIEPEKMSIGEKIVSFRQLIKRFSWFQLAGARYKEEYLNPALNDIRNVNIYKFPDDGTTEPMKVCDFDYANVSYESPQATGQAEGGTPAITQKFPFTTDLLTNVCSIFAYTRGSIRIKFVSVIKNTSETWKHSLAVCHLVNSNGANLKSIELKRGMAAMNHRAASVLVAEDVEEIGEVQFPYYSDVVYMPKHWANFGKYNQDFGRIVVNTPIDANTVDFMMWRAAGDDFDCAFLMGVPQMQYVDTTLVKL
uniref:Putative structural protein n=1 Tax=Picornavirales Q_sR_OV_025 TaxID=2016076 RepID=A0A218NJV1_9VIRU|nr:putative structural protein [Picornavirales Q_sR_OV_025]